MIKKIIDPIELYNQPGWADRYDALSPWFPNARMIFEAVAPYLSLNPKNMLDVGIGTGLSSLPFKELGNIKITGVDGADRMLKHCAEKTIANRLLRCDFETAALPVPDKSFDLTISHATMYLLYDSNLLMNEMIRVTKPGGLVAFNYEPIDGAQVGGMRTNDATHTSGQAQAVNTFSIPRDHVSQLFEKQDMERLYAKTQPVQEKMDGSVIFFETLVYRRPFSL